MKTVAVKAGLALLATLGPAVIGLPATAQNLVEKPVQVASAPKVAPPTLASKDKEEPTKVPDSVKSVVKRLNTATEDVSLEDLNSAREAVAKLDILIDIEKRLNDLSKLRQEREDAVAEKIQEKLPPPSYVPPVAMTAIQAPPPMPAPLPEVDVQQIAGTNGHYTATLSTSEGKTMTVCVGDKLQDGSVVQAISSRSVTLVRDKKPRTVYIKNVAVVFNGR